MTWRARRKVRYFAKCSCGRTYTRQQWYALKNLGVMHQPADEYGPESNVEMRNCSCGSTMAVEKGPEVRGDMSKRRIMTANRRAWQREKAGERLREEEWNATVRNHPEWGGANYKPPTKRKLSRRGVRMKHGAVRVHVVSDDAYTETQVNDDIKDGDVIVDKGSKAIAILMRAWPMAITQSHGEFHTLESGQDWASFESGEYRRSYQIALKLARNFGWPIRRQGVARDPGYRTEGDHGRGYYVTLRGKKKWFASKRAANRFKSRYGGKLTADRIKGGKTKRNPARKGTYANPYRSNKLNPHRDTYLVYAGVHRIGSVVAKNDRQALLKAKSKYKGRKGRITVQWLGT